MFARLFGHLSQFSRDVWVLSFGWFVGAMGFAAAIPFIAIYFHDGLNMSMTEIGLFFGAMALVRSVFQALGGELSDRMSRKTMLVWAQIFRAVSFLFLGIAIEFSWGFWPIAVFMTTGSIFGAVYHPALQALVADLLPPDKRLDGYALTRSAGNLGWAAGPAIGGFLAHGSYAMLFYIAAAIMFISGLIFNFVFVGPKQSLRQGAFRFADLVAVRKDTNLAIHCILCFLLYLVVAQLIAPFSVYAVEMVGLSELKLGYLYGVNGLFVALVQVVVTRMLAGYKFTTQLALGSLIYFVGYGLIGLSGNYSFLLIMMLIVSTGEVIMSPPSITLTSKLAPEGQMGRYMGVYGFFMTAGWSLGPLYGGWFLDQFRTQPSVAWVLIASLALVAAGGFAWFGQRLPERYNRK